MILATNQRVGIQLRVLACSQYHNPLTSWCEYTILSGTGACPTVHERGSNGVPTSEQQLKPHGLQ